MKENIIKEKVVSKKVIKKYYSDIILFLDLLGINDYLIIEYNGIFRFRGNKIIEDLINESSSINMNLIWEKAVDFYSLRDIVIFYINIGYSLCGFEEIFTNHIDDVLGIVRDSKTGKEISRKVNKKVIKEYDKYMKYYVE